MQPIQDEFFRTGQYAEIPLVLLHDRVIGRLPDSVATAVGLQSAVREVNVGAAVLRHIWERRQVASVDDVMVSLNRIEEAFSHLVFVINENAKPDVFALLGELSSSNRLLILPIKLVRAAKAKSGADELWLRTAHPCGKHTLKGYRARNALSPLPAA